MVTAASAYAATGTLLAGLGLFFTGWQLQSGRLRELYSRRLRLQLAALTGRPAASAALGVVAGFLGQNATTLTLLTAGAATAGLVEVARILPFIIWMNVGRALWVFGGTLTLGALPLWLVGITGIMAAFSHRRPSRFVAEAALGLALIFYGLSLMQQGAGALADAEVLRGLMVAGGSLTLVFAAGALAAMLAQSSVAVTMLAMPLAAAGVLSSAQLAQFAFGSVTGISVMMYLLSGKLEGTARQVAMTQVLFNLTGGPLFALLCLPAGPDGTPWLMVLAQRCSLTPDGQVACLYLAMDVSMALALSLLAGPLTRVLARRWPAATEEEQARIAYLRAAPGADPAFELALVRREQDRLLTLLPGHLQQARQRRGGMAAAATDALRRPFLRGTEEIDGFLAELAARPLAPDEVLTVTRLAQRQRDIRELEAELTALVDIITASGSAAADPLLEGVDALLMALGEAATDGDWPLVLALSADRGEVFTRLREVHAARLTTHAERLVLAEMLQRAEQVIWQARRLARDSGATA